PAEVRAGVDCVSGKVFFSTEAELGELRKLKSGERLFLMLKKHPPLAVSRNKGKMLHEIKSLVIDEPKYWLDGLSIWKNIHGCEEEKNYMSQENHLPLKRKSQEETNTATKKQKTEQTMSEACQVEAAERYMLPERKIDQDCWTESKTYLEDPSKSSGEKPVVNEKLSFRVSCRCSGAVAKILHSQPFPVFSQKKLSLANREYIRTAGLRSTIAWAMASLAEISAGAFVLDPMCGLGTLLLEAAKEWPVTCYWGADISDSQLEGADVNIRTADLMDKIELLKASVKALPLPSESFDAVISDIPFGKKFKVTKDIQLLPDILQEMERYVVLRVGGTVVLLLSQDLCKHMDGITKCAENDSPNAVSDSTSETATAKALNIDRDSSSLMNGAEESFLSSRQTQFGSLVPDGIYGVSLGKTDAFIYRCRKISTVGNQQISCTMPK
uniref:U6 snRNA (guanine-N(2))-methyltransferase THUMPD2 n=1 Tax=Athene cunicularia TaxID=194338 RepID=A0A663N5B1_ATHCN